jgi:hypothetical protein
MSTTEVLSERVQRELSQKTHDFYLLNGDGGPIKEIIAEKPIKDADELRKTFSLNKKVVYAQAYDKIEDPFIQQLLLHLHGKKIEAFIDAKDDERKKIIEEAKKGLSLFDEARETQGRLEVKKENANEVIDSTEILISKLSDKENHLVRETGQKIQSLKKEIASDHPNEGTIDQLIIQITDNRGKIIGDEQINKAKDSALIMIGTVTNKMLETDTPEDVKAFFAEKIASLKKISEGTDVFAMQELIAEIGMELVEKTSKEIRATKRAIQGTVRMNSRIIMYHIFKLADKKYTELLGDIITMKIAPAYAGYTNSLGRFGKKQDPLEIFTRIIHAAMTIITDEMILVHTGNDDIDSVELVMNNSTPADKVDEELSKLQAVALKLSITDLTDQPKRLSAIKEFLAEVKLATANYFVNETGYTTSDAKDIVEGPLFSEALKLIAPVLSEEFNAVEKSKS